MASSIWADLCCRESIISNSSRHHPCFYLVLQNNNLLNQQTLSPADFRRILKLSQSMSSGILETRSQLSSWQLQQSLTGQHCPQPMKFTLSIWIYCNIAWYLPEKCIDWGSLRSGQFSLLQKSNLHPAQQLILKIIIFIPKNYNLSIFITCWTEHKTQLEFRQSWKVDSDPGNSDQRRFSWTRTELIDQLQNIIIN